MRRVRPRHRHRRKVGHPQLGPERVRRSRGLLARRKDGRMENGVLPPGTEGRLPHLRALLQVDTGTKGLFMARKDRCFIARRGNLHRQLLQNVGERPIQDTEPRHVGTLPGQNDLSPMPWHAPASRSRICESGRTGHFGFGRPARHRTEEILRHADTHRPRGGSGQTPAHRNQQPHPFPARRRTGIPHPEPPEQHAFGRRKPTHQPGHVIGQQPGGVALHPGRTEHRTAQP